jgi:hypothetical protein
MIRPDQIRAAVLDRVAHGQPWALAVAATASEYGGTNSEVARAVRGGHSRRAASCLPRHIRPALRPADPAPTPTPAPWWDR